MRWGMGKRILPLFGPTISNSLSNDDSPELYVQLLNANWIVDNTSLSKEGLTPLAYYYPRTFLIMQPIKFVGMNLKRQ